MKIFFKIAFFAFSVDIGVSFLYNKYGKRGEDMIYDMHAHTDSSHDARQTIDELCVSAIEKGLTGVAVTDHANLTEYSERLVSRLKRSISQSKEANEKYQGKLRVFTGIELSEQLEDEKILAELMGLADYDVVLASRHYIRYFGDEWETPYSRIDFSHRTEKELREFFLLYLEGVHELVEKADFDILTHLTCPLRYINGKFKRGVRVEDYESEIRDILKAVISRDLVLEVNTSGLGNAHGETMPCDKVLSWYKELGGHKISLGGDSHVYGKVANGFDTETEVLKKLGFNSHCYFEKRVCHEISF